jgi:dTMP kinase
MFIAIEGIDGSGKGTHTKKLNKWVKEKGHETHLTREPTAGEIGKLLRKSLKKALTQKPRLCFLQRTGPSM